MNLLYCFVLTALVAQTSTRPGTTPTLDNGSFESPKEKTRDGAMALPAEWKLFTSSDDAVDAGVTTSHASDGVQACVFKSTSPAGAFCGLVQEIDVKPGQRVTLEADVRNDPSNPLSGTVTGQLSFEWLAGDKELDRSYSGDWGQNLPAIEWTTMTLAAAAPKGATRVRVVITLRNGDSPTGGAFLVDNLRVTAGQ